MQEKSEVDKNEGLRMIKGHVKCENDDTNDSQGCVVLCCVILL